MRERLTIIMALLFCFSLSAQKRFSGFFDFTWHDNTGHLHLEVPLARVNEAFLYVNSMATGVGSNDIGLDRGQLGNSAIVRFIKVGPKLLLIQSNMSYRANSSNPEERRAVEEAFAQSVLWSFDILDEGEDVYEIDFTPFLLHDRYGVADRMSDLKQGSFSVDIARSAVWMERTKSFPDNSEFESILTFDGRVNGQWLRSVSPSGHAFTVRQHHSFVRLPDDNYSPRKFHPYSGYFNTEFYDYATSIDEPIEQRYILRHRLNKKKDSFGEAADPIIYYLDPGCPEPIRSALIEGASWWDQAFQSAGFAKGTFQVRMLPDSVDVLDVRYNVIEWVHRSTRGWSEGTSITDPRTGEIIKGLVRLGSLRVRQDYLIAQGILSPYGEKDSTEEMKHMALARLRQLSAHEVGHTLGLAHNFAASANDRASVMDYPHPYITNEGGRLDFSEAYDVGIGEWDKRAIQYGYREFESVEEEKKALSDVLLKAQSDGLYFISDSDARPAGGAHPTGHLWDNGSDPVAELERLLGVRKSSLDRFGKNTIPGGTPFSELEKILVPAYMMHRYQVEAVAKLIGGLNYAYKVKGDQLKEEIEPVSSEDQLKAIKALLTSLHPEHLVLPENIVKLIPPPAPGYGRSRETFEGRTNIVFDPLAPAESYISLVMDLLLNQDRLARIHRFHMRELISFSLEEALAVISNQLFEDSVDHKVGVTCIELVQKYYWVRLLTTLSNPSVDPFVTNAVLQEIQRIEDAYLGEEGVVSRGQKLYLKYLLEVSEKGSLEAYTPELKTPPPGSPIGCGQETYTR